MNILIIGNGGREHALGWKASQSPLARKIYIAPGNAGTELEPKLENINISSTDIIGLLEFAKSHAIDLTIVGPEAPLVMGIVDIFRASNLTIFGPTRAAAQLESSKAFTKDFLARHKILTAEYKSFTDVETALSYIRQQGAPIVIKADGLASGKGVVVAMTLAEAESAVNDMLVGNVFGYSSHRIVIEEFLKGEEASFIVMVDSNKHILTLATSQDHKRVADGDTGPNTGGMGAYSPVPVITDEIHKQIMEQIILPTVHGMEAEGNSYTGFLYAGLMISLDGKLKVIEFNCRLGDPETQPIMLRLQSDLVELCLAGVEGKLNEKKTKWNQDCALGIVIATEGYPRTYRSGDIIDGLPLYLLKQQVIDKNVKVFHAGTSFNDQRKLVTNGGRVFCVTALGDTFKDAQVKAYGLTKNISWPGSFYRTDIGYRVIAK